MENKSNSKIDPEKFYRPKEVGALGILPVASSAGRPFTANTRHQVLLRFIRQARFNAINVGTEKQPRYVVQGKHLIAYKNTQMKKGEYQKKKV